jgi:hypothetical protein
MKLFSLLLFLITLISVSSKVDPFPKDFNILYLDISQDRIAKGFYDFVALTMNNIDDHFKKNEEVHNYVALCEEQMFEMFDDNDKIYYHMYLASGWNFTNYGNYERCDGLNEIPFAPFTSFIVMEEYDATNLKEKLSTALCIPKKCADVFEYLNDTVIYFDYTGLSYKIRVYPDISLTTNSQWDFIWFYLLVAVIALTLVWNVIMTCIYDRFNPYDVKKLKFEQMIYGNPEAVNRVADSSKDTTNTTYEMNCITSLFNHYFSLGNNMFVFTTVKNAVYDDKNLRLVNGLLIMITILQIVTNMFNLINIMSRSNSVNISIVHAIYDFIATYGKLYIEFITFIFAFIITFKFLNYTSDNKSVGFKVIFWFIRQLDKLVLFGFLNLIFYYSVNTYMHLYRRDTMLWFLYDKFYSQCSYMQYIPFYEFYNLISGNEFYLACLNSDRTFLQLFYIFTFACLLLLFIRNRSYKFLTISSLFVLTLVVRVVFSIFAIDDWLTRKALNDLRMSQTYFDYLHCQFFYNLPNLLLGILTGYIYYLDKNLVKSLDKDNDPSLTGIERIRYFFANYKARNVIFLGSLICSLYFGLFNNIQTLISNRYLYFFILSINGVFGCLLLALFILTVKVKSMRVWFINKLIINFIKRVIRNDIVLALSRSYFCAIISCHALIYIFILNIAKNTPVYYDFFNVVIMLGIPVTVCIFLLGFVLTLFVELPMRIFLKNKFSITK